MVARGLCFKCVGSVVVAHGLGRPTASGILDSQTGDQTPATPYTEGGFLTIGPPGKSPSFPLLFSTCFFQYTFQEGEGYAYTHLLCNRYSNSVLELTIYTGTTNCSIQFKMANIDQIFILFFIYFY